MFAFWYLFNYFHFVRQKYGILRIYSGKAQWGHKRLDAWTMYLWGLAGFFYLFGSEANVKSHALSPRSDRFYTPAFDRLHAICAAILFTIAWLVYEFRSPQRVSFPKLLFFISVVFLYGIGPTLSAGAIYIATSINHASEYIALVALTIKNKVRTSALDAPLLNKAASPYCVQYLPFYRLLFAAFCTAFTPGRFLPSSFLLMAPHLPILFWMA